MRTTLGIVGMGNFGAFAARHLVDHFELLVCDARDVSATARSLGCRSVSLTEAAAAERVVLAVPVAALPGVLEAIAPHLKPGALVIDVASVKLRPLQMMHERLPAHVDYLGTHPLFGPQSGAQGIRGLKIAVCSGRAAADRLARLRGFLSETLGLRVLDVSPEEHDRQMAYVQALTHLIGWSFKRLDPPESPLSTVAYESMLDLKRNVAADSLELFHTIQRENPFAEEVRSALIEEMRRLNSEIEGGRG